LVKIRRKKKKNLQQAQTTIASIGPVLHQNGLFPGVRACLEDDSGRESGGGGVVVVVEVGGRKVDLSTMMMMMMVVVVSWQWQCLLTAM